MKTGFMYRRIFLPPIIFVCLCFRLYAGTMVPFTIKDYSSRPAESHTVEVLVDESAMRADVSEYCSGGEGQLIYHSNVNKLYFVDHSKREVQVYDGNMASRFSQRLGVARNSAEKAWRRFQGRPAPKEPTATLKKTDAIHDIGGLRCRAFLVLRNGKKKQEIWAASWKEVGISQQELSVAWDLFSNYAKVVNSTALADLFPDIDYVPVKELLRINGYPVLIRHFNKNGVLYDISLHPPKKKEVNPSAFKLPKGYIKRNGFKRILEF